MTLQGTKNVLIVGSRPEKAQQPETVVKLAEMLWEKIVKRQAPVGLFHMHKGYLVIYSTKCKQYKKLIDERDGFGNRFLGVYSPDVPFLELLDDIAWYHNTLKTPTCH